MQSVVTSSLVTYAIEVELSTDTEEAPRDRESEGRIE